MGCCHYYAPSAGGDTAFSINISAITFGTGTVSSRRTASPYAGLGELLLGRPLCYHQ